MSLKLLEAIIRRESSCLQCEDSVCKGSNYALNAEYVASIATAQECYWTEKIIVTESLTFLWPEMVVYDNVLLLLSD